MVMVNLLWRLIMREAMYCPRHHLIVLGMMFQVVGMLDSCFLQRCGMGKVRGKDQQGFHQTQEQYNDNHPWNHPEKLPGGPGHKEHGGEGNDRSQYGKNNRLRNLTGTLDRRLKWRHTVFTVFVDGLPNDDRIVNK